MKTMIGTALAAVQLFSGILGAAPRAAAAASPAATKIEEK